MNQLIMVRTFFGALGFGGPRERVAQSIVSYKQESRTNEMDYYKMRDLCLCETLVVSPVYVLEIGKFTGNALVARLLLRALGGRRGRSLSNNKP